MNWYNHVPSSCEATGPETGKTRFLGFFAVGKYLGNRVRPDETMGRIAMYDSKEIGVEALNSGLFAFGHHVRKWATTGRS